MFEIHEETHLFLAPNNSLFPKDKNFQMYLTTSWQSLEAENILVPEISAKNNSLRFLC